MKKGGGRYGKRIMLNSPWMREKNFD